MKRQQLASIVSVLVIVTCIPWIAHSQLGGGMSGTGGMGGGMGGYGMGGMGGMGGYGMPKEIVTFKRPEGPVPSWLTNGLASVKSTEKLREQLNQRVHVDAPQETFAELIKLLRSMGIDVELDAKSTDDAGITIESCEGLPEGDGPLRELLIRTLDPQQLAYRVFENHIQITTQETAEAEPTINYYDLAFVQTDNKLVEEIILAIQESIQPELWTANGGAGSIRHVGQLLIVRATESAHLEIERMLARFSLTVGASANAEVVTYSEGRAENEMKRGGGSTSKPVPPDNDPFGSSIIKPAPQDNDPFK